MAYKYYKKKSEVAHHASKALSINVTTTFQGLLTLLASFRTLKTLKKLLELIDIKIVVNGSGISHGIYAQVLNQKLLIIEARP